MRGDVDGGDDRLLAERARHDPDAFAELYRRHVEGVYAFCWRRTRDSQVAEDLTAATFERALRALPGFRWRDGGFRAWLYRIAANQLVDHYRREGRRHAGDARLASASAAAATGGDPADLVVGAADGRGVLEALTTLRPRHQEVVTLRYLAGLSADEAATALGMSKPVLAVTLHRALRALRAAMGEEGR